MTTTVVKTIKSGGDYTTLQAWEDACPANLVTSDQIWQGQASGSFSAAANLLTVSGATVDATRYLELTTEAGQSFRDNASVQTNALRFNTSNGCSITDTAAYTSAISVAQEFCRFSNLQIACTNSTTLGSHSAIISSLSAGTSAMMVDNCILESSGGTAGVLSGFGSNMIVRNSLMIQRKSAAAVIIKWQDAAKIYNCTIIVPNDLTAATNGIDVSNYGGSSGVVKNVALFGCTNIKTGTSTPTVTTSYTSVASPPSGWTNAANSTAQFVNVTDATRDYRAPSGSALVDVGTTDSTNAQNDIAGTTRPSGSAYDVGCWELVVSATNIIPLYGKISGFGIQSYGLRI